MKAKGSSSGGKDFEIAPAGSVPARLVKLLDFGEQHSEEYEKWSFKIMLSFELPTKLITEGDFKGKPFLISRTVTNSMHPKSTLRGIIGGWIGALSDEQADNFDLSKLLGQPCLLSVIHKTVGDKTYANIGGVMALPDGMECPPQVTDTVEFDLDNFNPEVYDGLPEWARDKIAKSKDFAKSTGGDTPTDKEAVKDDGPPF